MPPERCTHNTVAHTGALLYQPYPATTAECHEAPADGIPEASVPVRVRRPAVVYLVYHEEKNTYDQSYSGIVGVFKTMRDADACAIAEFQTRHGDFFTTYMAGDQGAEGVLGLCARRAGPRQINQAYAERGASGCLTITAMDGGDEDWMEVRVERHTLQ